MPESQTIPIRWLTDKDGNKFFPRTHTKAVKNNEGTELEVLLQQGHIVLDGGNARTISQDLAARRIDCGTAADKV